MILGVGIVFCTSPSCVRAPRAAAQYSEVPQWIQGDWTGIVDDPGVTSREIWLPTGGDSIVGLGLQIEGGDTTFREDMVLHYRPTLQLAVIGVNEGGPTIFEQDEVGDSSFTVINLENPFPTHIRYWRSGDTLCARVFKEETSLSFAFLPSAMTGDR
ncbi:MAG: DUF6265 family protein [Bacteroidota bacterium]